MVLVSAQSEALWCWERPIGAPHLLWRILLHQNTAHVGQVEQIVQNVLKCHLHSFSTPHLFRQSQLQSRVFADSFWNLSVPLRCQAVIPLQVAESLAGDCL